MNIYTIRHLTMGAVALSFLASSLPAEARLAKNSRRAVVLEAFYALRPSHDGGCDKTISGNCVASWPYLTDDLPAYQQVKNLVRLRLCVGLAAGK